MYQSWKIGATGYTVSAQFSIHEKDDNICSLRIFKSKDPSQALDGGATAHFTFEITPVTFERDGFRVSATMGTSKTPTILIWVTED